MIHLSLHLVIDLVAWVLLITGVALSLGLAVTVVFGVPVVLVTLAGSHLGAKLQRWRCNELLDADIALPAPLDRSGSWWRRTRRHLGRRLTWKELAHHLVAPMLGVVTGAVALAAWCVPLALLSTPLVLAALPDLRADLWVASVGRGSGIVAVVGAGLGLLLLAPWIVRAMAVTERALARSLLGPNQNEILAARVDQLQTTRAAAMDAVALERQRIERNLHDGAQQRLVAVAMGLGMAREKFDADPDAAKALVAEAHDEAKRAIAELRDLARGIHPAVLTDRGLDAAISAVAARCPVPVEVRVEVSARPSATIEATAYFLVTELLTNLAKHSAATHGWVTVVRYPDRLVVDVRDDGIGGADALRGSGLAGLRDRVAAADGTFVVWSPPGGPTVVQAVLPCAS
jgi:signal transduction histidine kinase